MAIQYFPRIDEYSAIKITEELIHKSVAEASVMAAVSHPDAYYYPTASVQVSESTLREFRREVMKVAEELNFPNTLNPERARKLDQKLSGILFNKLDLIPAEAANPEVWNFLTLVVLPDISKWRFPNEKKILDYNRWLGEDRNVLRKLWWREATLGNDLNRHLGEDEAVGIMERPLLAGQTNVARAMVKALLKVEEEFPGTARSKLLRVGAVNLRRYVPFTAFEFFSEKQIDEFVLSVFRSSGAAYVEELRKEKEQQISKTGQEKLDLEKPADDEDNQRVNQLASLTSQKEELGRSSRSDSVARGPSEKPKSFIDKLLGK